MSDSLNKDLYASFHYDSKAQPPLRFQIRNGVQPEPLVDEGMSAADPAVYTAPCVSVPGAVQAPEGEDLNRVAAALVSALKAKGVMGFTLQPAEQVAGVAINLKTGLERSETPASWEVVRFVARTAARIAKASAPSEPAGE